MPGGADTNTSTPPAAAAADRSTWSLWARRAETTPSFLPSGSRIRARWYSQAPNGASGVAAMS
ncbi:MAG: hypothetical protein ABIQ18_33650 [Umezawaea sp.]